MKTTTLNFKPLFAAMIAVGVLSACGGGGGGTTETAGPPTTPSIPSTPSTPTPTTPTPPAAVPGTASMTMTCPEGGTVQCSGGTIIRIDNGVALTSSGVQVYGRSTSDLATPIVNKTSPSGFQLASGGVAEVRLAKAVDGTISSPVLMLNNLGLSWDGKTERPSIIETFMPTQGRVSLASNGTLLFAGLPPSTDLAFYDYATRGENGTQANYANNRHFPRTGNPPRCPPDFPNCPATETVGVQNALGDWRAAGGSIPDWATASRLHEDGDVHAGNGPTVNGVTTFITDGTAPGVPFPGSKGFRHLANWGLQYANLSTWVSQDTVQIEEWARQASEHNKIRRGIVTYGAVTDPAAVPTAGTATYSGIAFGWYASSPAGDPPVFRSPVTITVNYATRTVAVAVSAAATYDAANTPLPPVNFTTNMAIGAAGSNVANYLTGTIDNGTLRGGIGGRLFGPILTTTSSSAPAEIGGSFSLSNATSGAAVIGGFIARKQ